MKVKLHSIKNEKLTAALSPVSVAASAPKFHPAAGAAGSENKSMSLLKCPDCGKLISTEFPMHNCNGAQIEIEVSKLEREEHCGDWHDKPLRWIVKRGSKCQKFSTKRDAQKYASLWRRNNGDEFATFEAWRKTF